MLASRSHLADFMHFEDVRNAHKPPRHLQKSCLTTRAKSAQQMATRRGDIFLDTQRESRQIQ